jgi:hypothetical protein
VDFRLVGDENFYRHALEAKLIAEMVDDETSIGKMQIVIRADANFENRRISVLLFEFINMRRTSAFALGWFMDFNNLG